jgi:glycosyltransferase involved in cell wall biosynthesis
MPLVSVITPVFNAAKWLPETMDSVRHQTLGDWEHILVDDGSTDNSIEVIERAAALDPRIKLLRMPVNSGPAKACNKAVEAATGRYLAFLDADDLWLPRKLERCVEFMAENGHVFTYHDYRQISHDGCKVGALIKGADELNLHTLHARRGTGGCLSVVIDHEGAKDFCFPLEDRSLPQDFPAWLRLIQQGHLGHRVPEDLARYRLSDGSRSSNKLKCAYRVWRLYRYEERLSFPVALKWWLQYACSAGLLYLTVRPRRSVVKPANANIDGELEVSGSISSKCSSFSSPSPVNEPPTSSCLPVASELNHEAEPLVSIITPVYNSVRSLSETMATVRAQTLTNWEHLLVDDNSTDGSVELIERAAVADSRIRLVKMAVNEGPGKARNVALREARGRYIAFLDSDDLWLPEKLDRCIKWMQENGHVFAVHDYRQISQDGKKVGGLVKAPNVLNMETLHSRRGSAGCLCVVIDRDKVPGFYFPVEDRSLPEDFSAWLWLVRRGYVGCRLPKDLARYRLSASSRSSNKFTAAVAVWRVYRINEQLPLIKALSWWTQYAWNSFWMYRRARPRYLNNQSCLPS